ncbi:MAG: phosphatidylcholine/phosphatidylserine synthase [Granulosicoccus sp.]|nr:phosphatidylcholine/phosphatidylserine synthase [Granulosicoccus sp.]
MDPDPVRKPKRAMQGIYLLPNLFTTGALLAGFYSIILAHSGDYRSAAIAILVAMILDGCDGRVARATNTSTAFGAEYDSMADMVSFGMAPAFLMYTWSLSSLHEAQFAQLGRVIAFVYTACCGLRLARFNVAVGTADKRFFKGLACPAAAAILASFVWVATDFESSGADLVTVAGGLTLFCALAMVSTFTYYSFKDLGDHRRISFVMLLGLLLLFVVTAVDPPKMILIAAVMYGLSGPMYYLFRLYRKRGKQNRFID